MQIYTLSEPIYGPESYSTVEKKIDSLIVHEPKDILEGAGLGDENPSTSSNEKTETANVQEKNEETEILNKLNQKTKEKLGSEIYKSFLNPNLNQIKTGSIPLTVGVKRKISPSVNEASNVNEKKNYSGESAKVKHKFHLI